MTRGVEARASAAERNPQRASVMYPPDRSLFAPFAIGDDDASFRETLSTARGPVSLYAHVPFCETKCTYCDYETVALDRHAGAGVEAYVDALVAELETIAASLPAGVEVRGFDIGGGTPGVLEPRQFARVVETVVRRFRCGPGFEVSTETTPTMAADDPSKWREIRRLGIDRVSMGVQTTSEGLLARLHRGLHEPGRVARGLEALRTAGFSIVNADLMFALPSLTLDTWSRALDEVVALGPDVVTIYDTVYKNRGIATQAVRWAAVPAQSDYGAQYDLAWERLAGAGYVSRYGSVNFSRVPGRLGTSRYLEGRILDGLDYVGAGLYASSLVGRRWRFARQSLAGWRGAAVAGRLDGAAHYALPVEHVMAKYVLLALSYGSIDEARFQRRFGVSFSGSFAAELAWLEARSLLRRAHDGWELVPGRFAELPRIRAAFFPDDAAALLSRPVFSQVDQSALR